MLTLDLHGKIAVVTGATGELGRTIARTLAECGADVAIHYHQNEAQAQLLENEISLLGVRALMVAADETQGESVQTMADRIFDRLGVPDIIVANAVAQIHPWSPVLEESPEDYRSQFESCVMQSVYLAKTFLPQMMGRGGGRYIAINTECSIEAAPSSSAYVAGKRGLDGLMRTLAKEVGASGVTVNQVAPGWMISDRERQNPIDDAAYRATVPLRRRGHDQDIANTVAFLASDLASFMTGAFLPVAGGRVMVGI
jgi:3-oxoacyl-[acyl-carrier protein] reductase